jgi:hypothetical protein
MKAAECRIIACGEIPDSHRIMLQHVAETWEHIATDIEEEAAK